MCLCLQNGEHHHAGVSEASIRGLLPQTGAGAHAGADRDRPGPQTGPGAPRAGKRVRCGV